MHAIFRICGNESQTGLQLFLAVIKIAFHWKERKNTLEKRTVRYKSQLICIYICHQLFFIRTSRIISFLQFEPWNQTCSEVVLLSTSFPSSSWQCSVRIWLSVSKQTSLQKLQLRAWSFCESVWRRKLVGYRIWLRDLWTGLSVGWGKPYPAPSNLLRPFSLLSLSFICHTTSKHFVDDQAYFAQ